MGKSAKKSRKRSRSRSRSESDSDLSRSRSRSPSRKKSKKSHKKSHREARPRTSSSTTTTTHTTTPHDSVGSSTPLTKAQLKALETPEERRARRLAKKQKKAEKKQVQNTLYGYTDDSNPFGDANLTQAFVWKKKYEKILQSGGDPRQISKAAIQQKQVELRHEIDQVKERRRQREVEKEAMEEMREMMRREADKEAVEGWEEKEEQFHRQQAKTRTAIRINAGREKAIDILAKNLYLADHQDSGDGVSVNWDVELTEPYRIFDGLLIYDLQELKKDIIQQVELGVHVPYWNALLTVCSDEIHKQQGLAAGGARLTSIPASVARDVEGILGGKSVDELDSLEMDINAQIRASNDGSGAHVDVVYWEAILQELQVYKAKAYLHEFHAHLLKTRLQQLKRQQQQQQQQQPINTQTQAQTQQQQQQPEEDDYEQEFALAPADDDDSGSFSPVLHAGDDDVSDMAVVDAEQDARELEAQRRMVLEQRQHEQRERQAKDATAGKTSTSTSTSTTTSTTTSSSPEDAFSREASKPMDGDEVAFNNQEITLEEANYSWHDKYRPRKPRYFNRVKTGFEWNRYNQTHYDKENPPPKIVQGYKFNLFYPDLIDPNQAPTYRIDPDPENPDYCTIRFMAGAPYEDIAFKIVRKEWEYTPKRGFKCVFDKGVLHLYFNFKRFFYRR